MSALPDDPDKSSGVLGREPDQEKSLDPSGPRIRCPLCGWSPLKDDLWACDCGAAAAGGASVEHVRPRRSVPVLQQRGGVSISRKIWCYVFWKPVY
jgi:hypothetical protein